MRWTGPAVAEPKPNGGSIVIRQTLIAASAVLTVLLSSGGLFPSAEHHHRQCRVGQTRCGATREHHARAHRALTGFVVEGGVSTFGAGTGDSEGTTADGGTTARPCIAIRDDSTLDHWFLVVVREPIEVRRRMVWITLGHPAKLLHCDYGPATSTGRSIDVTGAGDYALGLSPGSFPTSPPGSAWAIARELR